jgi:phenylacetate-CoA ligase
MRRAGVVRSRSERHWSPGDELLQGDDLRKLQDRLLVELVRRAARTPFYRRRFQEARIDFSKIRGVDDLRHVPFTTKDDTRARQEEAPPWGDYTAVPFSRITNIHMSSGTTGAPTANLYTRQDYAAIAERLARACWAQGVRPGDIAQLAYTYRLFAGGWAVHIGLAKIGPAIIPVGTGGSEQQVEIMRRYGTTAFFATPSYALHLYEVCRSMGIDPRSDLKVRIMQLSGEPGASIPAVRDRIEGLWGAKVFDAPGQSEAIGWCASCGEASGPHIIPDHFIVEVLHPETKEPVQFGEPGVAVVTNLRAYAQPLLRWWTNDIVVLTDEPCLCGRPAPRLPNGFIGRADDMLKVSGTRVWPAGVESALREIDGFDGEFRIVIDSTNLTASGTLSRLKLQVEASPSFDTENALRERVAAQIQRRFAVSPEVEVVPAGSLERFEMKAKRVVRERVQ